MRTVATEFGHISEAFTRIALAAPQTHFTLRHNDKPVFELAAGDGWLDRIGLFFGRELRENLIWVESVEDDVSILGYAAHPSQNRSHNRMQYFFLNGRFIRDRALQHALGEAYRGLIMTGRQPIAFLRMTMPPDLVDVNVHPTKLEVRFQDSGRLYSQLLAALRAKFLTTDLNTRVHAVGDSVPEVTDDDPSGGHDVARTAQLRQQLVDWAKGKVALWGEGSGVRGQGSEDEGEREEGRGREKDMEIPNLQISKSPICRAPMPAHPRFRIPPPRCKSITVTSSLRARTASPSSTSTRCTNGFSTSNLRQRVAAGSIETQSLLVPEPVELSPAEMVAALEHRQLLAELGVRVEPFGGNTLLVFRLSRHAGQPVPADVLRALLECILAEGKQPDRHDLLDDLLHTIACKAAIKAGDRLSAEEIASLLEQRHLVQDAHHCPHGRPTAAGFHARRARQAVQARLIDTETNHHGLPVRKWQRLGRRRRRSRIRLLRRWERANNRLSLLPQDNPRRLAAVSALRRVCLGRGRGHGAAKRG